MTTHNASNERIKRQYLGYLKEAQRQSEATVDAVAAALARFEAYTQRRDFRSFHSAQAIAFKRYLSVRLSTTTEKRLSKATIHATLAHLSRFFRWLSGQPGYKSRLKYTDADYFNLSQKDVSIATARRETPYPTVEQVKQIISAMPAGSDVELRNRAVVAFALLTGARDGAIASMKLKHVDLSEGRIDQDARDVKTKFSKTFQTFFFPVGGDVEAIVRNWVTYLRDAKHWGNDDPVFPSTEIAATGGQKFEAIGLRRVPWSTAGPIREIFRVACANAGQPYFKPHSIRRTLVQLGQTVCQTPEDFKAWSQNLGHEGVLTTFHSYGAVTVRRQAELIGSLTTSRRPGLPSAGEIARAVARELREFKETGQE